MKTISTHLPQRILFIEREEDDFTSLKDIPDEYLKLIIPYAGQYFHRDGTCDMLSQCIRLKDFTIWAHEIFAHRDFMLNPYTPRHILALHYMDSSSITALIQNKRKFRLRQKEMNLFNLHSHFHQAPLKGGSNIFSFHINIAPAGIGALATKFPGLTPLAKEKISLKESGPVNDLPLSINSVAQRLIEAIFRCRYIEVPADCFLYRCCADLFLNYVAQVSLAGKSANDAHKTVCHKIFKYILTHIHEPLTTKDLAAISGLRQDQLSQAFLQVFAITVEDFVLQQKMMSAYHLMATTNRTLQQIAAATGCGSSHALVKAFENYYGYDTGIIRLAH